jgi:hypothetical protein
MRTHVQPEALGACAQALSRFAGDLAESRRRLSAVHAASRVDLGRAGASAADQTAQAADRALGTVAEATSAIADALRLLAVAYDDVDRAAVR